MYVRGLSIPKESFLLLEFLHLVLILAVGNEGVDVAQVPLSRNLKPGILLPDAAIAAWRVRPMRGAGPHSLGTRSSIHLLLVEGHPLGIRVGRHWLLGTMGEHRGGAHIVLHGQSVIWQRGGWWDEGGRGRIKVSRTKGVHGLGCRGRPGPRVVGNGP